MEKETYQGTRSAQQEEMVERRNDDLDPGSKDAAELNRLFDECEFSDRDLFAEMRSNVLLVNSEHYSKRNRRFYDRIRSSKELNQDQKLRLTKKAI